MIRIETHTVANLSRAEPGERFTFKGIEYTVEGVNPYVNAVGIECVVVTVSTFCTVCGAMIEVDTRRRPKWLPRTCGAHKGTSAAHKSADAPRGNVGPLDGQKVLCQTSASRPLSTI